MGKVFPALDDRLREWIERQQMFFVASAPLAGDGHVNLSPKGLDSLAILGDRSVAYLDLVGSGAETIAHLRENQRITLLFCAFEGPPRLLRLYGRGQVIEPGDEGFEGLAARFPAYQAARSIIRIAIERIADSCGYGVPNYAYQGQRQQLLTWADRKGEAGIRRYQLENNTTSLDGLPALHAARLQEPDET